MREVNYIKENASNRRAEYMLRETRNDLVRMQDGIITKLENDVAIDLNLIRNDSTSLADYLKKFDTAIGTIVVQDAGVKIFAFGKYSPTQQFKSITEHVDFNVIDTAINVNNTNMFIGGDIISGFYNIPVYSRTTGYDNETDNRRFESTMPFEINLNFPQALNDGEFYIIDTPYGIFYTSTQSLRMNSQKTSIRSTDYKINMGNSTIAINPVYAYLVSNKLVTSSGLIIAGSTIRKMDIQYIEINRVYLGRSLTTFPITIEVELNFGKIYKPSFLSLSAKSDIVDSLIKLKKMTLSEISSIEQIKSSTIIEIIFNSSESVVHNLSIIAKKKVDGD